MGATKGNKNALKHGLYAKHYTPAEQAELRRMSPDDLQPEQYMQRVVVRNLFEIQEKLAEKVKRQLEAGETPDTEALSKISNSFTLAVTALNTTTRTLAVLRARDPSLNDALAEALSHLEIFKEDNYLLAVVEEPAGQLPEVLSP